MVRSYCPARARKKKIFSRESCASSEMITFLSEFDEDDFNNRFVDALMEYEANDGELPGFEWEGYDGWYNNPAHPDWGGAGMQLPQFKMVDVL